MQPDIMTRILRYKCSRRRYEIITSTKTNILLGTTGQPKHEKARGFMPYLQDQKITLFLNTRTSQNDPLYNRLDKKMEV